MASAVDLFCGAGGLTHGLERAGIKVNAGFDIDPSCRFAFEANNKARFIQQDIFSLTGEVLSKQWGTGPRILVGCAPCQTFSTYSMGKRQASSDDKRWKLISEFQRLASETMPEIISMENVPRASSSAAFLDLVLFLKSRGYFVWHEVVNCVSFGVPQNRKRLVLLASCLGSLELNENPVRKAKTVRDAISHLESIEPGCSSETDPLHYASRLTELNLLRVRASRQGGTWKDWPEDLRLACHKKCSGKTYRNVYGRMQYDEPAPTLTTLCLGIGNGRFIHPEQDRGLSIREAALLQSFPETYQFAPEGGRIKPRVLSRLIGNAVPVALAESIGCTIRDHLAALSSRNLAALTNSSAIVTH